MGKRFDLYLKDGDEWIKLNAVFPFTTGDLLDERLDEATVVFFSSEKSYKPLTEFKAEFFNNNTIDEDPEFFILANDNSAEMPSGSGRYRHEVYLIERTKLLEGYLSPSITFTHGIAGIDERRLPDANARNFEALVKITSTDYSSVNFSIAEIKTAFERGSDFKVPTAAFVGEKLAEYLTDTESRYYSLTNIFPQGDYTTRVVVFLNDQRYDGAYYDNEMVISADSLQNSGIIRLNYMTCLEVSGKEAPNNVEVFDYTFLIQLVNFKIPIKPYTITDCVIRTLELATPLFGNDAPKFTFDGAVYRSDGELNIYTVGSQAEKYNKIIAPEFTMTQATLREQLKVIGSYIHAEPWLDENNVVHFLDLGEQTPVRMGNYISNTLKTDINSYCTEIRSNAQNLVSSLGYAKGVMIEPGNNLYRSLRCETMYVRINEENGIAATDFPIYSIETVMCGLVNVLENGWVYEPRDITPFVFESSIYGANLSSYGGGFLASKSYSIYYTIGEKGLHGLFYQDPDAKSTATYSPWAIANILAAVNDVSADDAYATIGAPSKGPARLVFQITYKPIAPGFISHGKQYYISSDTPYTQIYNQSENLIETQYFGENMKGVAARLGNIEMQKTYMLSSRSQIPRVGMMLDGYSIAAVNTEYMPNFIKCTLGLSKDYNRISEYVGVSSVKRMYEISERQATNRDILVKESIVITSDASMQDDDHIFFVDKTAFIDAFTYSSINLNKIRFALFYGYTKNGADLGKPVLLPIIGRAFGNTVHFAFKFKDNYSAGDKSEYINDAEIKGYWQNDVPYTDYFGRIYWAKIMLAYRSQGYTEESLAFSLPSAVDAIGLSQYTHIERNLIGDSVVNALTTAPKMRLRKDNREIIGFNIEAEFKTTDEDIIIGSELAARCRYLNYSGAEDVPEGEEEKYTPTLYISQIPINKLSKYVDADSLKKYGSFVVNSSDQSLTIDIPPDGDGLPDGYDLSEFGYWCIAMPVTPEQEKYTDEEGSVTTMTVTKGGEILLGGKILRDADDKPKTRILYFRTKRS